MRRPSSVWLATLMLASCGSASGAERSPGQRSPDPQQSAPASRVTNQPLAAALAFMCEVMTEELADRARVVRVRWGRANERIESSEHRTVLAEAFGGRMDGYADLVETAEARGVPGFHCDSLELLLELYRSGESDVDPSLAAPFAADIERMCALAAEVDPNAPDAASRAVGVAERWDLELTNPELLETISAIAAVPPAERYPLLQAAARDAGIPRWRCDAIRELFAGR